MHKYKSLLLSLMVASCDYCESAEKEVAKAAHTLINKYPKGHEVERAEAVGLEYRMRSLSKTLVERQILKEETFKEIVNYKKATIDKEKLEKELFSDMVFAEKFCKELEFFLEKNPDVRTDEGQKVKTLYEFLIEQPGEERSKKIKAKGVKIIHEGLRELYKIEHEDFTKLYPRPEAPEAEARFRAMQPLPPYVPTVYPPVDRTKTPLHKVEKRKLVFKASAYPLANHRNHELAYMFLITNQPNIITDSIANSGTLHNDVEFEYEYMDTNNKDLRFLFAEKNCRAFLQGITKITKTPPVRADNRYYPVNVIGHDYKTNRQSLLHKPDLVGVAIGYDFGDFYNFHRYKSLRYTFEGGLTKWAYERVYNGNLDIERIAQRMKVATLMDLV